MDESRPTPDIRSKFSRDDFDRLQKINDVLCEHTAKASQIYEELYSFLKSIYEPSDDN